MEQLTKRALKKREGELKAFPLLQNIDITKLITFYHYQDRLMMHLGIKYPSWKTLMIITIKWLLEKKGITTMEIVAGTHVSASAHIRCVHDRLQVLLAKGLIYHIGTTKLNAKIYGPSQLTMTKLAEILRLV